MDAQGFIERIKASRNYRGQIAAPPRCLEARPGDYRKPQHPLPDRLVRLLRREGIDQLYSHQAEACDAIRAGEDVVIATGTASGKSLCYQLPVLADLLDDSECRALYLFPAKALAYDQLGNLQRMVEGADLTDAVRPACYDGDTPTHKRPGIRRTANVIRDEVATMRRNAIDSQYREVRVWSVVTFQGGPLDGLRIRVLPNEAGSYRVGFCIVTRTGPVQALYEPGPAGVSRFASLERDA